MAAAGDFKRPAAIGRVWVLLVLLCGKLLSRGGLVFWNGPAIIAVVARITPLRGKTVPKPRVRQRQPQVSARSIRYSP
jgi:hypothetical protein